MKNLKYNMDNCVCIKHKWEQDSSRLIQVYNKSMDNKLNYITKAIKVNIQEDKFGSSIKEGDTIFLSRFFIACRKFKLSSSYIDNYDYSNIPVKLIMGKFNDGMLNLGSLEMFYDKVLIEPMEDIQASNIVLTPVSMSNVGRVVKHGRGGLFRDYTKKTPLVKEEDIVLYWNNVNTDIFLNSKKYHALEDNRIIGSFSNSILDIENLEMANGRILLKDLEEEKIDMASKIILPNKDNDFEFQSNLENKYTVFKLSKNGKEYKKGLYLSNNNLNIGDTLVVNKDILQHVYFKGIKYYTLENLDDAEAIIKYV